MKLKPAITTQLADHAAERVRRNHEERIAELQGLPAASAVILRDVQLIDGSTVFVPHPLGRSPSAVTISVVRNAAASGSITEPGVANDRTKFVPLLAQGWGSTITVDVVVW